MVLRGKFREVERAERALNSEYIPMALGGRTLLEQDFEEKCAESLELFKAIGVRDLEDIRYEELEWGDPKEWYAQNKSRYKERFGF